MRSRSRDSHQSPGNGRADCSDDDGDHGTLEKWSIRIGPEKREQAGNDPNRQQQTDEYVAYPSDEDRELMLFMWRLLDKDVPEWFRRNFGWKQPESQ